MSQGTVYRAVGIITGIAGVAIALLASAADVTYTAVEGIAVFAVLYVIAQGVERVVEWVVDLASLFPASPGKEKDEALRKLVKANSTMNGNPSVADFDEEANTASAEKATVEEKRTDITFLAHGLSILLAAIGVKLVNYGIFSHLGATGVAENVDQLLTALAAAGGSKSLHELIGRLQKAKEGSEETPATT